MPIATPVSRCQKKRRTPRRTKLPTRVPTPTAIALVGRERPDRAERQQAVEDQVPEHAGRDQRGQLVEGAVADPPVVVVVEAVELDDEDPDRAEEDRPEQRRRRRARGRRGDDAAAPPTSAAQSPSASSRRSSAPRWREPSAPLQPEPRRRLGRRGRARRARRGRARRLAPVSVSGARLIRSLQTLLQAFFARVEPLRFAQVGLRRGFVARRVLDPRPQVVEDPVVVFALDRLAEPFDRRRVVALALGQQAELQVGGGRPGLDRAGRVGVVDGARPGCRRATASLLASISRSTSSGPISARAAIQATARPAIARPKRRCDARSSARAAAGAELRAAGRDQGPGGEEEDRRRSPAISQNQSIAGADREGEHRRRAAPRRARAAPAARRPPGGEARSTAAPRPSPARSSAADHPELGERLQVERVGVEDRQVDRARSWSQEKR